MIGEGDKTEVIWYHAYHIRLWISAVSSMPKSVSGLVMLAELNVKLHDRKTAQSFITQGEALFESLLLEWFLYLYHNIIYN